MKTSKGKRGFMMGGPAQMPPQARIPAPVAARMGAGMANKPPMPGVPAARAGAATPPVRPVRPAGAPPKGFKRGGRIDGCAARGKTKGRMI